MSSVDDASLAVLRGPGRPRVDEIDDRVLTTVTALIDAGEPLTLRRIVAASGVSRAAVYRRWPSTRVLVAAALDVGRASVVIDPDEVVKDLRGTLARAYTGGEEVLGAGYPAERMRHRLRLALGDRELQRTYWDAHVTRRRQPIEAVLRLGVERGVLRADLDIEAALDLLSGVYYYQIVTRGADLDDPDVVERCAAAVDIVLRGMEA